MSSRKKQRRPKRKFRRTSTDDAKQALEDVAASSYFGLTPRQDAALTALLNGASNTEAAKTAGVHRNTLLRWRDEDRYFTAALEFGQLWLFHSRMDQLRAAGHTAMRELLRIGTQRTVSAEVRINALKFIVDKCALLDRESPPASPSAVAIDTFWGITRENRHRPDADRVEFRHQLQAAIAASPIGRELMHVDESLKEPLSTGKSFPQGQLKKLKQRREQIQFEIEGLMRLAPEHGRIQDFISKEAVDLANSLESGRSSGEQPVDASLKLNELHRRVSELATADIERRVARQEMRLGLTSNRPPVSADGPSARTQPS